MSLRPCPCCRKEISFSAKSCPNCGELHPFRNVTSEMLRQEVLELDKKLGKIYGGISKEDEEKYLKLIEESLLNRKFWMAFSIAQSKLKKSESEADVMLNKMCESYGISNEFLIWKRKRYRPLAIIIISVVLIGIVLKIIQKFYSSFWNDLFGLDEELI